MQVLEELDLEPSRVAAIETLSERHGYRVWRMAVDGEQRILKWLPADAATREIGGYELLHRCGVPTLPVYGQSDCALMLEDLASSSTWRLADARDVDSPNVAAAIADWYCALHMEGEKLLASDCPGFLRRETDELTPDAISRAARSLRLADAPVRHLAVKHIALSCTFNYADFHWTNLALSRADPVAAVVFDYDKLGIGMRYSDCRNVMSSLGPAAREAFGQRYGKCDEREMVIDRPLACLYALVVASRLPSFPKWAEESRCRALNGELERELECAVAVASDLVS
jgi:hypothetical protein